MKTAEIQADAAAYVLTDLLGLDTRHASVGRQLHANRADPRTPGTSLQAAEHAGYQLRGLQRRQTLTRSSSSSGAPGGPLM
ncbi:MAG TPA: hypothetical protein VFC16_07380 [Nakamurella sp.]|nr:hypothetical protein [Nakamurella sp.]